MAAVIVRNRVDSTTTEVMKSSIELNSVKRKLNFESIPRKSSKDLNSVKRRLSFDAIPSKSTKERNSVKRKLNFDSIPVPPSCPVRKRRNLLGCPEDIRTLDFNRLCNEILELITYDYANDVLIWCPITSLGPDYVASVILQYGEILSRRDRWIASSVNKELQDWGGLFVTYENQKDAIKASEALPLKSRNIETLLLSDLMDGISKIEADHLRGAQQKSSEISITYRGEITEAVLEELRKMLKTFGVVNEFICLEDKICVKYKYVTHAYLAALVLNDMIFELRIRLTVNVENSQFQELVEMDLKKRIKIYMESLCSAM